MKNLIYGLNFDQNPFNGPLCFLMTRGKAEDCHELEDKRTCDVIISPEVHFNVVPLEDHAALHARSGDRHEDVVLVAERVDGQGF